MKQKVILTATGQPNLSLEVKEIDNEENIQVGPYQQQLGVPGQNTGITARTNISAYTVAANATIFADEQKRPAIDNIEIIRATYEEEPTVAVRSIMVDPCGDLISAANPFPVAFDGSISIGDVSIVEGGNTMTVNPNGTTNVQVEGPNGNFLEPNSDGSVKTVTLFNLPYDTITATYPLSTQEVYQSRVGGILGAVQQTVTVNYTDATKNLILNAVRT